MSPGCEHVQVYCHLLIQYQNIISLKGVETDISIRICYPDFIYNWERFYKHKREIYLLFGQLDFENWRIENTA